MEKEQYEKNGENEWDRKKGRGNERRNDRAREKEDVDKDKESEKYQRKWRVPMIRTGSLTY